MVLPYNLHRSCDSCEGELTRQFVLNTYGFIPSTEKSESGEPTMYVALSQSAQDMQVIAMDLPSQ